MNTRDYQKQICAKRIKMAMGKAGIKQKDLCDLTGISKSAMSQYLSGAFKPKYDKATLIANALNVSESWLMGYDTSSEDDKSTKAPDVSSSSFEKTLSDQEKTLLKIFRDIDEEGKMKIIQFVMNMKIEAQKNKTPKLKVEDEPVYLVKFAGRNGKLTEEYMTARQIEELKKKIDSLPEADF